MIKFVHQTKKIELCRFNLQHVPYVFLSFIFFFSLYRTNNDKVSLKFVMFYKLRLQGPKFYFMSIIINFHFQCCVMIFLWMPCASLTDLSVFLIFSHLAHALFCTEGTVKKKIHLYMLNSNQYESVKCDYIYYFILAINCYSE